MKCQILYFARMREVFATQSEAVLLPEAVVTVADLLQWLRQRGEPWLSELASGKTFRVAVNQDMVDFSHVLSDNAEIAIFPPVTGG